MCGVCVCVCVCVCEWCVGRVGRERERERTCAHRREREHVEGGREREKECTHIGEREREGERAYAQGGVRMERERVRAHA